MKSFVEHLHALYTKVVFLNMLQNVHIFIKHNQQLLHAVFYSNWFISLVLLTN